MTLIACLHPRDCRTLLADVLVSSPDLPQGNVTLPTRAYIAPDRLRAMSLRPAALRRKVIEINKELAALWSGDYNAACTFAKRAQGWFHDFPTTDEGLKSFLDTYYRIPVPNFSAIIAPSSTNWFYNIGTAYRSHSAFAGDYVAAGSGVEIFKDMVDRMKPSERGEVAPDMDGLRVANDLMAREINTGEPLHAQFGGSYEVLYRGPNGFERVDDALHVFALAKVQEHNIEISHYPHAMRQWYEGNQLCVASFSTPEVSGQGLGYRAFAIPAVLDDARGISRSIDSFATRPQYMCVHHLFDFAGRQVPSTMTMRADAIDQHFKLVREDTELRFDFTDAYAKLLHEQAALARQTLAPQ
jgi:hypothetical protein